MTASHALFCFEHQKTTKNVDYSFGYRSSKDYLYHFNAGGCTWWWGERKTDTEFDEDYAYVKLSEPVGDVTGWLGCCVLSDADASSETFYNAGYRSGLIMASMGDLSPASDKLFYHYMDTEAGYSGSPVYDVDGYAVGINVAENPGAGYNLARRITGGILDHMRSNGLF